MSKDIYELLNDIEYDSTLDKEIPIDDIQKKRLKKKLNRKIKGKRNSNLFKVAMVACLAFILLATSTVTTNVVAKIKEFLFFNPGLGVVSTSEDTYVLKEPISTKINGKNILIKSVISKKNQLNIGIWVEKGLFNSNDEMEKFKVRLSNGEVLDIDTTSVGSGGDFILFTQNYKTTDLVKEFTILFDNNIVSDISLVEENKIYSYSDIGGNSVSNWIMIGGNKYLFGGNTYISLWNNDESKLDFNIFYDIKDINVSNKNCEVYKIDHSNYSGTGNEFVINDEISERLNIKINNIEASYLLKNTLKIKVNIPKKDETVIVNEEIYIEDLDEKIVLKSIKRIDNSIELSFDVNKFKKENSQIFIINAGFRNHGVIGSADGSDIIMSFDYEDLKSLEKATGKLEFYINTVDLYKKGNWEFTIK